MSGALLVFVLALAGVLLVRRPALRLVGRVVGPRSPRWGGQLVRKRPVGSDEETLHEASMMVAQLAALLRAGRSPEQMWTQASQTSPRETASVLAAAAHASAAGAPVAQAIRAAAGLAGAGVTGARSPRRPRHHALEEVFRSVWGDVAACIEAAEESGCPLAGVLDRLSAQLEADADAAAARATALAGPRATTRILSVLPLAGLAMGALLGVNPLGVLVGTPWGAACLAAGLALTLAGRVWSSRLVAAAGAVR